jgi:hypothetical protein
MTTLYLENKKDKRHRLFHALIKEKTNKSAALNKKKTNRGTKNQRTFWSC